MTPEQLLERIQGVMTRHVLQIDSDACSVTKEGKMKGFTTYDSQVLERYAKILITLTKKSESPDDEFAGLTDDQLQEELDKLQSQKDTHNADETSEPE